MSVTLNTKARLDIAIYMMQRAAKFVKEGRYTGLCIGIRSASNGCAEHFIVHDCLRSWIHNQLGHAAWLEGWLYEQTSTRISHDECKKVRLAWADHMIGVLEEMKAELP